MNFAEDFESIHNQRLLPRRLLILPFTVSVSELTLQ